MAVEAAPSAWGEVVRTKVKQRIIVNLVVHLVYHQNLKIHQILLVLLIFGFKVMEYVLRKIRATVPKLFLQINSGRHPKMRIMYEFFSRKNNLEMLHLLGGAI